MRRLALIASVLIGASSGAAYAWPFSGISVQAEDGAPLIESVVVDFGGNDNIQQERFNRQLGRYGADTVSMDVTRRGPVHRVIVYTNPRYRGTYSILAQ